MDIEAIVNSLFESGWESFHDAVYEATDVSFSKEELKDLFYELPMNISNIALEWGLSDTVFGDEVYTYIKENLKWQK